MFGVLITLLGLAQLSPIPYLASLLGATEPALKLLISILIAYYISVFYHSHVVKVVENKNLFFIFLGLDMAFFNFGLSMYHNIIPPIVMYASTKFLGPGKNNVIVTFIFNMTYLVGGYVMTESEEYDITWTMPHCVSTLKLIALSFDLWDGQKKLKGVELSASNKVTALETVPSFVEIMGFVYFPACFLVGPIFSFTRYKNFINNRYPIEAQRPVYAREGMTRLLQGIAYMVAHQVGGYYFNMKFILSDEFSDTSIFYRHFYCGLWAHFALYKYISCWLLTEAACIRIGLAFNGVVSEGDKVITKWDGCNNIKLLKFEGATRFQHYIDSFNCNTNHFALQYVYKRLQFLGNKNLSQLITLVFLAVWHGTQSGYYMTFFNEFLIMVMEKDLETILIKSDLYHKMWSNNVGKYVLYIILKTYTIVFMGWSLVPFDVKSFSKWWKVYSSLWFSGFILFLPWSLIYKPRLIQLLKVKS